MAAKSSDWRQPGSNVCRCCFADGCYKDISTEYFWMGKREVYSEMLTETFDVNISYTKSGGPNSNSRLICEPCISRLRDATDFKKQVVECEKTFMQCLDPGRSNIELEGSSADKSVKVEYVKLEKELSDDDFDDIGNDGFGDDDDEDDDLDDQPLTKLASKIPKKESVDLMDLLDNDKAAQKRKASAPGLKIVVTKKAKTKKDAKPVASKVKAAPAKPEKKKKEGGEVRMAKRNAEIVLQYSTVYPFRLRGNTMVCVYCCEEHHDPAEYRQHIDTAHEHFTVSTAFWHVGREYLKVETTNLKCRICEAPADTIQEMAQHLYDCHPNTKLNLDYKIGMQPYKIDVGKWDCAICMKRLPSLINLGRHTTSHYKKFVCETCGRNYLTNEALKYHVRCSHSGKYQCRKCWQEFPSLGKRNEHKKTSKSCWTFCCIQCGERFMSWENKQRHLVTVHGAPQTRYDCPDCDLTFTLRKHFYDHYKKEHSDESHVCSCCGLKFVSKRTLEDHTVIHTGEKAYKCEVCLKGFSRQKNLRQHMWTHSELKPFSCVVCEKQFAQKISLKGHMKTHHPDVSLEM